MSAYTRESWTGGVDVYIDVHYASAPEDEANGLEEAILATLDDELCITLDGDPTWVGGVRHEMRKDGLHILMTVSERGVDEESEGRYYYTTEGTGDEIGNEVTRVLGVPVTFAVDVWDPNVDTWEDSDAAYEDWRDREDD